MLWLSPWLRSLSRIQVEAIAGLGHEVLLVTSDQHPESDAARPYELVLTPRPKRISTWPEFARGRRRVRAFAADVIVSELVRDPRWTLFAPGRPRVTAVHDDRVHDVAEERPRWERALFDRWAAGSAATVAFSDYVADQLAGSAHPRPDVVPLTSDLDDALAPAPASAADRRDFVVFGRLNPYKNLAVTFDAWRAHVAGPGWAGDELVLIGDGELPGPLPPSARWQRGTFAYTDAVPLLHRAKGALVNYRQASQSGVQLTSMQLGVTPIVTATGALPDFQPPGEDALDRSDVAGLAAALDSLADPRAAARRGTRSRQHYEARFAAHRTALAWQSLLERVRR